MLEGVLVFLGLVVTLIFRYFLHNPRVKNNDDYAPVQGCKTREQAFCEDYDLFQFAESVSYWSGPFEPEEYDWAERIDVDHPEKYEKGPFTRDFGHGEYTYVYHVYDGDEKWVYAQHWADEEELKTLVPHCACRRCTGGVPTNYLVCACCVGCLKMGTEFAQGWNIKQAREKVK